MVRRERQLRILVRSVQDELAGIERRAVQLPPGGVDALPGRPGQRGMPLDAFGQGAGDRGLPVRPAAAADLDRRRHRREQHVREPGPDQDRQVRVLRQAWRRRQAPHEAAHRAEDGVGDPVDRRPVRRLAQEAAERWRRVAVRRRAAVRAVRAGEQAVGPLAPAERVHGHHRAGEPGRPHAERDREHLTDEQVGRPGRQVGRRKIVGTLLPGHRDLEVVRAGQRAHAPAQVAGWRTGPHERSEHGPVTVDGGVQRRHVTA